jgi:hypothetical protein
MVKYTNRHFLPSQAEGEAAPQSGSSTALANDHAAKAQGMQPKMLRATITVEMEACDYVEAAEHQKRLQAELARVRQDYPGAWLTLGGRHERGVGPGQRPRLLRQSGRLNDYE